MKVAIIGAGNVGSAVARAVTNAGHDVIVAAPSSEALAALAGAVDIHTSTSNLDAVAGVDAVVLAVPFGAVEGVAAELADELAGKIVIDATNPLAADLSGLATSGTSAAELIQLAAPRARVVKAFNTVFAANQADGAVDGVQLDGFVAADDAEAKATVIDLLGQIGYRPVDVGPLSFARHLEGMALINIALNASNGWSWRSGWKLVGPNA